MMLALALLLAAWPGAHASGIKARVVLAPGAGLKTGPAVVPRVRLDAGAGRATLSAVSLKLASAASVQPAAVLPLAAPAAPAAVAPAVMSAVETPAGREGRRKGGAQPAALERLRATAAAFAGLRHEGGSDGEDKGAADAAFEGSRPQPPAEEPAAAAELETLRTENALLKARLAEKSRMLAKAVHDLRSPLTVVLGHAELLGMDAGLSTKQRGSVDAIVKSGKRLNGMVTDILELERSESAELPLKRQLLDLGELLRASAAELEAVARPRGIRLAVSVDEGAVYAGDAKLLRRLVDNLAGNGVKYNKDGGALNLSVERRPGGWALVFQDEGRGVPAEELPQLFSPFFRASSAKGIPGTGLGLAGVKAIAERHGGTVLVESQLGIGTRFTVFLPD